MSWDLNSNESLLLKNEKICNASEAPKCNLVAILRVRNESLILKDTLDHLSEFADVICAYDDASTDDTFEILEAHEKVKLIIRSKFWQESILERLAAETRHRGLLLSYAEKYFNCKWILCCDADERFVGDIKSYVSASLDGKPQGVRIQLFDAYITPGDDEALKRGEKLLNFRKFFGPECRKILMLWQKSSGAKFIGLDAREPILLGGIGSLFYCQHYGKSLSYKHWEETCDYYVNFFPWDSYGKKWFDRKNKALHVKSDFGRDLFEWGPDLFLNSIDI